jgi:GntR family transcriptional regulator/MocR family aminotransferase
VEDDYDGEYRYVSRPLPALQSLDRNGRVLYSGTFSKVLFPAIRLAYLVVPPAQVPRFDEISRTFAAGGATLMQQIVADFMNEGHFARHIQRMRRLYGERRQLAADGLTAVLGKHMQVDPQPGGMHLVLRMKGRHTDRTLAARMRAHGMAALPCPSAACCRTAPRRCCWPSPTSIRRPAHGHWASAYSNLWPRLNHTSWLYCTRPSARTMIPSQPP